MVSVLFKKNTAFSLVELSMVVTIIALLVVSVAASYKLIDRAKVKGVAAEINTIETAFIAFQETYNAIPGDMANAYDFFSGKDCGVNSESGGTQQDRCNGDGDLFVKDDSPSGEKCREEHNAWNHLSYADLMKAIRPSCAAYNPSAKYTNLTYSIRMINIDLNPYFLNQASVNVIRLGKVREDLISSNSYNNFNNNGKLLPPQFLQILDRKLDDGIAFSGKLLSVNGYDDSSNRDGNCSYDTVNATNTVDYQLSEKGPQCVAFYQLKQIIF